MKKYFLLIIILFEFLFSAQSIAQPEISIYNMFDMRFTHDGKYLVINSVSDPKVWNLVTKNCISFGSDFTKDNYYTKDKSYQYLAAENTFYFHHLPKNDDQLLVLENGNSDFTQMDAFGKDGKFTDISFNNPASFFLVADTFLKIRLDKKFYPYISVEKSGTAEPVFTSKFPDKNTAYTSNVFFTVLPGNDGKFFLVSLRAAMGSTTAVATVIEIDLTNKKTTVLSNGLSTTVSNPAYAESISENLKASLVTPGYVIVNINGYASAVRKSDGKLIKSSDVDKLYADNAWPHIIGERNGKLIVRYKNFSKENTGFGFDLVDADNLSKTTFLHYKLNLDKLGLYQTAASYDGNQLAIAVNISGQKGYYVDLITGNNLEPLVDQNNTAKNLIAAIDEQLQKDAAIQKQKMDELSNKTLPEIISRKWKNKYFGDDHSTKSIYLNLNCNTNGYISGTLEYVYTGYAEGAYGQTMFVKTVKYDLSGQVTGKTSFSLKYGTQLENSGNFSSLTGQVENYNVLISLDTDNRPLGYGLKSATGGSYEEDK